MKQLVLYTGEYGAFLFHISLELDTLSHDDLKNKYHDVSIELYDLKHKFNKLKNHRIIKLLIYLKLIKL